MGYSHLVIDINSLIVVSLLMWGCYWINRAQAFKRPGLEQLLAEDAVLLLAHTLQTLILLNPPTPHSRQLVTLLQFINIIFYYAIHYSYYRYAAMVIGQKKSVPRWLHLHVITVVAGLTLMECVAYIKGWFYTVVPEGRVLGPYYMIGNLFAWYEIVLIIGVLICNSKSLGYYNLLKLLSFLLIPGAHALTRGRGLGLYMTMPAALTLSCLFLFILYYLERSMQLREQKMRSAEDRLRIAVSQIQPHFIYNELNTIYVLCEKDPELAQKCIGLFSDYLRSNLDGMQNVGMIPLEQELRHVKTYLELERIRFRDRLVVDWQIEDVSCMLPPLTIQPLVENAVKHGVTKKREGGRVVISVHRIAEEDEEWTEICIEDDGAGFDPEEIRNDGKIHIGINNVRERIDMLCGGTLQVESEKGKGTRAVIRLPRQIPKDRLTAGGE